MTVANVSKLAGGDISPSRIVVGDTTDDYQVIQATNATVRPVGVSGENTRFAPNSPWDDGFHAQDGDEAKVYQNGQICLVKVGSGGIANEERVKSDGTGQAIGSVADGEFFVGIAQQTAVEGDLALVLIDIGQAAA